MKGILIVLLAIVIVAILFLLGGLIYWGIGSLICVAFHINYNWTFLCGLATQFITFMLITIFGAILK